MFRKTFGHNEKPSLDEYLNQTFELALVQVQGGGFLLGPARKEWLLKKSDEEHLPFRNGLYDVFDPSKSLFGREYIGRAFTRFSGPKEIYDRSHPYFSHYRRVANMYDRPPPEYVLVNGGIFVFPNILDKWGQTLQVPFSEDLVVEFKYPLKK